MCYACNSYTHMINKCPQLFYQPNREKLIKLNNKTSNHFNRNNYERIRTKKYHTLREQSLLEALMKEQFNISEKP